MKISKALIFCASCLSALITGCGKEGSKTPPGDLDSLLTPLSVMEETYSGRRSDIAVTLKGKAAKVLRDDNEGGRHQRFVLELSNGQTILITHNIDLAPRVPAIAAGDLIYVRGEYVFNEQGGLIHWTHKDPNGLHEAGWIIHRGNKYQ